MGKIKRRYLDCFESCIQRFEESEKLLTLALSGIAMHQGLPKAIKALHEADEFLERPKEQEKSSAELELAKEKAHFAAQQIERGVPLLLSQTVLSQWSFLEACIYDAAVSWLVDTNFATVEEHAKEIKIEFFNVIEALPERLARSFIKAVERKAQKRHALAKFESLLDLIGWHKGGSLHLQYVKENEESVFKQDVLEFSRVRNLILHNNGIVDNKFIENCPWMDVKLGEELKVDKDSLEKYSNAAMKYMTSAIYRSMDTAKRLDMQMAD